MIPQMILSPERFTANITGIRPFIGMRPFVDQQIVRFRKLSAAKLAYELFLRSLLCNDRSDLAVQSDRHRSAIVDGRNHRRSVRFAYGFV